MRQRSPTQESEARREFTPLPLCGDPARVHGRGQTAAAGGPWTPRHHGAPVVTGRRPPGPATPIVAHQPPDPWGQEAGVFRVPA